MSFHRTKAEQKMGGPGSSQTLPKPKKGKNLLSFPPLVAQFRPSGQEPTWPGQEYTRRTRLKTHLDPAHAVSTDFVDEMKELLGANYSHFEEAMKPQVNRSTTFTRGKPPSEKGHKPIQPSYKLPRAVSETATDGDPFASTTRFCCSGMLNCPPSSCPYIRPRPCPRPGRAVDRVSGAVRPWPLPRLRRR